MRHTAALEGVLDYGPYRFGVDLKFSFDPPSKGTRARFCLRENESGFFPRVFHERTFQPVPNGAGLFLLVPRKVQQNGGRCRD